MYLYLFINLAIIALPLAISFERKRINYFSKSRSVILSIIIIGTVFVAWDIVATSRGHWSFNPNHVIGLKFLGLPFEEILFFVTVPFSCILTYEALAYFIKDESITIPSKLLPIIGVVIIVISIIFYEQEYTFLAMLSVGLTFLSAPKLCRRIFSSKLYWFYIAVTLVFFLVFNFLLTSVPVVEYSEWAISNLRITTIPIEDFMFNFSMLTLYLAVHLRFSKNRRKVDG